jgi:DNA-binding NtrC family response regulator
MHADIPAVLVIDDNVDLAENIAEILEDVGVDVHLAESAEAALAQFSARHWNLVVTDVRMPGLDGIELVAQLKRMSPETPILVMTGYADNDTRVRAHESGALGVVHKPLDVDMLLELIQRLSAVEHRVLIVEDDAALVANLTEIVSEQSGLVPHPAANIALARRLAGAIDFEFALIDLRLPDGDGITLARELLDRESSPCKVIIITGYPERLQGYTDERVVILPKPLSSSQLLQQLRQLAGVET